VGWPLALASAAEQREAIAATGASTRPTVRALGPQSANVGTWKPLFRGIAYARAETSTPRPLQVHAVRVDLQEPTIHFFVTPSNGNRPGDTDGRKTSTFLREFRCQVAINASPYAPLVKAEGKPQDVHGLSISRGDRYSRPNETYAALLITRDNKARISKRPMNASQAYNAVGGFRLLLQTGKNVAQDDALHPRSAAGICRDGRYLYLVVIDGRQPGYSEGTTTAETAEWMRMFGAYSALNLDGGGSSTLATSDGRGGARLLNRPIHAGIPNNERVNANHLGVRAVMLDKPVTK
jgi:hypothetical protein